MLEITLRLTLDFFIYSTLNSPEAKDCDLLDWLLLFSLSETSVFLASLNLLNDSPIVWTDEVIFSVSETVIVMRKVMKITKTAYTVWALI